MRSRTDRAGQQPAASRNIAAKKETLIVEADWKAEGAGARRDQSRRAVECRQWPVHGGADPVIGGPALRTVALQRYDAARRALSEARAVDEVMDVRDEMERLKLYARQANDRDMLADATAIHLRATRQLGIMIAAAKAAGQVLEGRPKKNCPEAGQFPRVTLKEAGISRNLSAQAQQAASISERAFEDMIERTRERIASAGAITLSTEEKQQRRADKERVLGELQKALPTKKYGVILADPEWRFEPWSRETGMDRSADNHYPTSVTEVIAARDVASIAAPDSVLFLWVSAPMLTHGMLVMEAWGFDYRSNFVWVKDKVGTGYWNRNQHEHLLVGVRGQIPCPAPGTQWPSVIHAAVGAHSAKPERFLVMIEDYYPTLPKIELNRRGPARLGWDAWGNEALRLERDTVASAIATDDHELPEFLRRQQPAPVSAE
jgi:N6-adenosine-specific RNA methylase IME4